MFASRYFTGSYFAPRYWPKVGSGVLIIRGPLLFAMGSIFLSSVAEGGVYRPGAQDEVIYLPGVVESDIYQPGSTE